MYFLLLYPVLFISVVFCHVFSQISVTSCGTILSFRDLIYSRESMQINSAYGSVATRICTRGGYKTITSQTKFHLIEKSPMDWRTMRKTNNPTSTTPANIQTPPHIPQTFQFRWSPSTEVVTDVRSALHSPTIPLDSLVVDEQEEKFVEIGIHVYLPHWLLCGHHHRVVPQWLPRPVWWKNFQTFQRHR